MSYDDIQDQIEEGLQMAADELGPPYDIYRLSQQDSNGNVLIPANKIATQNIFNKVAYGSGVRESLKADAQRGILAYRIIADLRSYKVGDIFILNDPVYGKGASSVNFNTADFDGFALADHEPMKKALGGRLNTTVSIFRQADGGDAHGRIDRTDSGGLPVVLNAGVFSLGSPGVTPAKIPAGLMALGRSYGDREVEGVPAVQRKSAWQLYMPVLNGFQIRDEDRIEAADGTSYIVVVPFSQNTGFSGNEWMLERESSGST